MFHLHQLLSPRFFLTKKKCSNCHYTYPGPLPTLISPTKYWSRHNMKYFKTLIARFQPRHVHTKITLDFRNNLSIYFKTYPTIKFWHTFIHINVHTMSVPCIPVQHRLKLVHLLSYISAFHMHCNSQWVWHNMLAPKYTSASYHWAHFYIHYLLYSFGLTHALEKAKSLTTIHKNCREWPVGGLDVTIFDKFSRSWNYWSTIFATRRSKHSEHYFQRDLKNLRIWW